MSLPSMEEIDELESQMQEIRHNLMSLASMEQIDKLESQMQELQHNFCVSIQRPFHT